MPTEDQIGPPVRVGDYNVSVTDENLSNGVLARAVLVEGEIRTDLPRKIFMDRNGLRVDATNVPRKGKVDISNAVLRALLKAGGWKQADPG